MTTHTNNPAGKLALVNGIALYYEVHGTGTPLILLHGGFGTVETFATLAPTLALHHQIISVDLYGHGRTALTDRPMRLEDMADDISALINALGLTTVDLLGYSLGGIVALQTTIRHPEQINKLVVISTPFKHNAWYPDVQVGMTAIAPEFFPGTPLHDMYMRLAPKPEDFPRLVLNMKDTMSREYDWTEQVAALKSPTLIIAGDADSFPPSHAIEFFSLLGGGTKDAGWDGAHMIPSQLAILPATTHYNIIFQHHLLLPILSAFLDPK